MSTGYEFPRIKTFESAPSAADFESTVELTNFPAVLLHLNTSLSLFLSSAESDDTNDSYLPLLKVFRGCASDWDAFSKWNPFNNGLDYLEVFPYLSLDSNFPFPFSGVED